MEVAGRLRELGANDGPDHWHMHLLQSGSAASALLGVCPPVGGSNARQCQDSVQTGKKDKASRAVPALIQVQELLTEYTAE